jgi:geranylgeranylglycerol-phosphate geranylgeranyltransferase
MKTTFSLIKSSGTVTFSFLKLIRIGNVVMMAAGVYLGAFLVQGPSINLLSPILLKASLVSALLGAAGYMMNDLLDVEADKINRPRRPLVSGAISISVGWGLFALFLLGAIIGSFGLTIAHQLIFVATLLLICLYNLWLSKLPLIGNLSIGVVVALTILFGALPFELTSTVWIAAGFAFLTTLSREIVKDVEDLEGDRVIGARTMPVLFGATPCVQMVQGISMLVVLASVLPYLTANFGGLYLIVISVTDLLLLLPMSRAGNIPDSAKYQSSSLKWAMLTGMIALAFSDSIPTY